MYAVWLATDDEFGSLMEKNTKVWNQMTIMGNQPTAEEWVNYLLCFVDTIILKAETKSFWSKLSILSIKITITERKWFHFLTYDWNVWSSQLNNQSTEMVSPSIPSSN